MESRGHGDPDYSLLGRGVSVVGSLADSFPSRGEDESQTLIGSLALIKREFD